MEKHFVAGMLSILAIVLIAAASTTLRDTGAPQQGSSTGTLGGMAFATDDSVQAQTVPARQANPHATFSLVLDHGLLAPYATIKRDGSAFVGTTTDGSSITLRALPVTIEGIGASDRVVARLSASNDPDATGTHGQALTLQRGDGVAYTTIAMRTLTPGWNVVSAEVTRADGTRANARAAVFVG